MTRTESTTRRQPLRVRLSLLLAVIGAIIGLYVANLNDTQTGNGYGLAQAVVASEINLYMSSFLAVAACLEGLFVRRFWNLWTVRRNALVVLGRGLLPIVLMGLSGLLVSYVWFMLIKPPETGNPGWEVPTVSAITAGTSILFGAAIGLVLRPTLAVSVAAMAPFLLLNVPHGWQVRWPRHLTGSFIDCCTSAFTLDPRPVVGSIVILLTIAIVSVVAMWARTQNPGESNQGVIMLAIALATLMGVVSTWFAVNLVRDLDYTPALPRALKDQVCSGGVCLWPEDERFRRTNVDAWNQVYKAWANLGLPSLEDTAIGDMSDASSHGLFVRTEDPKLAALLISQGLPGAASGCESAFEAPENQDAFDQLAFLLQDELGQFNFRESDQPTQTPSAPRGQTAIEMWETIKPCH